MGVPSTEAVDSPPGSLHDSQHESLPHMIHLNSISSVYRPARPRVLILMRIIQAETGYNKTGYNKSSKYRCFDVNIALSPT